jgi:hypothetical protein
MIDLAHVLGGLAKPSRTKHFLERRKCLILKGKLGLF